MEPDDITGEIVDASIRIHRDVGPGLLESFYEAVLARALERRGLAVERQVLISFEYDDMVFRDALRLDLLVEEKVVVEVKAIEKIAPVHPAQLLTYLKVTELKIGLLTNFGAATMKEGLKRVINDSVSPRLRASASKNGGLHAR